MLMKNIVLSHKLSPKLLITPQLREAFYILQLPCPALKTYVEQKVTENLLLQPPDKEPLDTKIKKFLDSNINYSDADKSYSNYIDEQAQPVEKQKPDTP